MKSVYISALQHAGDEKNNIRIIEQYCGYAAGLGVIPLAAHPFVTNQLAEGAPIEQARTELLKRCDEVWQMGCIVNEDMQAEADTAEKLGIPVYNISQPHELHTYPFSADDKPLLGLGSVIDRSIAADFKPGDILVCRHDYLKPDYRTPLNQLWHVTHGNGCKIAHSGRSIFCEHIKDGDTMAFYREDLYGIVRPEVLSAVLASYDLDLQHEGEPGQDDEDHGL